MEWKEDASRGEAPIPGQRLLLNNGAPRGETVAWTRTEKTTLQSRRRRRRRSCRERRRGGAVEDYGDHGVEETVSRASTSAQREDAEMGGRAASDPGVRDRRALSRARRGSRRRGRAMC
jgi:hypothetical protein